jgi:hypothetical protein
VRRLAACLVLLWLLLMPVPARSQTGAAAAEPLRLGMAGLVHGHASKIMVHDGHSGPKAIYVQPEFFA